MASVRSLAGEAAGRLRLSARQAEVLSLVEQGLPDREIAVHLGCSYRTVRTHLERLYAANGFRSRTAAAVALSRSRPDS